MFARQSARDLLGGPSHRKAVPHKAAQVRLAFQLEAAIPSASAFGKLLGADRLIASGPDLGPNAVAPQFAADRSWRPPQIRRYSSLLFTACMPAVNLDPLLKAELAISLFHRNNTPSRCCTCSVNSGDLGRGRLIHSTFLPY